MTPQRKLKQILMKHFLSKKYTKRGRRGRYNKIDWNKVISRDLAKSIQEEIDNEILEQLKAIAANG
jgi:hypothetical protein